MFRRAKWAQRLLPHPMQRPWDYLFGKQDREYWVIATLADKTKMAGRYGHFSFASSAPAPGHPLSTDSFAIASKLLDWRK